MYQVHPRLVLHFFIASLLLSSVFSMSSELLSDTCSMYIFCTIEREDYKSVNITGKVEVFTPSLQMQDEKI